MDNKKKIDRLFRVTRRTLFRNGRLSYDRVLEIIEKLAILVMETETEEGFCSTVGQDSECDLCSLFIGSYWHLADHHSGQGSDSYRVLCKVGEVYKPGCCSGPQPETMEQDAYEMMERLYLADE